MSLDFDIKYDTQYKWKQDHFCRMLQHFQKHINVYQLWKLTCIGVIFCEKEDKNDRKKLGRVSIKEGLNTFFERMVFCANCCLLHFTK